MENFRKLNFGPKLYDKLILMYPQLSSLMFSANITSVNTKMGVQNVNKERLGTSVSSEGIKRKNCEKNIINSYISSKFAKNEENLSNKIPMDANFYKYKKNISNKV